MRSAFPGKALERECRSIAILIIVSQGMSIARQILPQQIYEIRQKPGFYQNLRRSFKSPKNPVS
ncbi:hypothetical protein [Microcoleus sp. herbarium12]|uniref:hypothetical protein n=1 Tax=Microcoleus sp. herbarium12 TaxID=3055437 RepID=UPI002FD4F2DC